MTNDAALDVGRLRLLREIGVRGSIAGAARALGLTPSAVSQQLAVLERDTGASLVDRSPRGVVLTGTGRLLAARAEEVLDVLAAARADLDRANGTLGGPVRVAAVASAALTFVSVAALALASEHAALDLAVTVAEPSRALELLLAGDVDLAVVDEYDYVPLALPEHVVAVGLHAEPLMLVTPKGWCGPRHPALADLADADWVMPPDEASCGLAVRSACRAAGFEPRVRWVSDDMLVLVRAVAAGHGVAVLPRLSVADDAAAVQLRRLHEPELTRRLTAVARASTLTRPSVAAVSAALADAARAR
ncbi:LysR family transcriptional regulator [Jatrophihabitans sp.]|uniref:LysR family transcriptional regulator n=1 Tax=Jatrophihabitans sp. TaxID=1932789 RepID=UPI0030C74D16|nr:transcriptional regulator, LysR family [Jatrophihabitans sp.]